MIELERMLKDTLTRMGQEFFAKLTSQGKTLEEQQRALAAHRLGLRQLQEENSRITVDLQALTRQLEDLAGLIQELGTIIGSIGIHVTVCRLTD